MQCISLLRLKSLLIMKQKLLQQITFLCCLCSMLMFSAPAFGQAGNTILFQAGDCGVQELGATPMVLTYKNTDATGRHRYENTTHNVLCQWNNTIMQWEFIATNFPPEHDLICFSAFQSFPNPPDEATGNYQPGEFFGLDCVGDGSNFVVMGTGTQDNLGMCVDGGPPSVTCPTIDFNANVTVQIVRADGSAANLVSYEIRDAGNNVVASKASTNSIGFDSENYTLPCDANYTFTLTVLPGAFVQNAQVQIENNPVINLTPPVSSGTTPFTIASCSAASPGACSASLTGLAPTVDDDCDDNPSVTYTLTGATTGTGNNDASGSFNVGTTTLTYEATDAAGNTGSCSVNITIDDNQNPTASCPSNITQNQTAGQCGATVNFTIPPATDNCPGVTTAASPASGSFFSAGTTQVTVTATDNAGNTSTCTFDVTINDTEAPTAVCLGTQTVNNDPGQCGTDVFFSLPNPTDNCTATSSASPASGSFFNVGTTQVTVTATDGTNTDQCTFDIVVNDNEDPTAICLGTQTVNNDPGQCGTDVFFSIPNPTDNCPGATSTASPASGSFFNVGTTQVTVTAVDAAGNTDQCTFDVVVNDTENPTINCPNNINVNAPANQCFATVLYAPLSTSDNCPGETFVCSPVAGSNFNVGTTQVTCTVTDAAGNSANCSFNITVNDVTPPSATCPNDINANAPQGACGASVAYAGPLVSDACGIAPEGGVECSPNSGSFFGIGTNPVTCTVMDANGNTTTCSFNININDNQDPVPGCPSNITQSNDPGVCGANVNFSLPGATDNCPGVSQSANANSGDFFAVGTTTVTVTATDASSNTSFCTFDVTVTDDEAPTMLCNSFNLTLTGTSTSITTAQMDGGSTDNCGIISLIAIPSTFNCNTLGAQTVSLTGVDAGGNSSTCTGTVTVIDNNAPTAVCGSPTVNLISAGTTTVPAGAFDGGSSAVCGNVTFSASQTDFDCDDVGNTIAVTLTVTAQSNNQTATCVLLW